MDDGRLKEIRELPDLTLSIVVSSTHYVIEMRSALRDLLASHDAQSTRIAELGEEVRQLTQCDTNVKFLLDCLEKAELKLPDYTLGTWQDRASGLAPAIATLCTRLSTLEKAAGKAHKLACDAIDTDGAHHKDEHLTTIRFLAYKAVNPGVPEERT